MNRSVMNRQMFAKGGPVRYMQQGGVAAPMPMAAPAPAPMPMAAPAPAPMPMAPPAMAAPPPVDPMAAAQEAINPAELEGMLAQASQTIGDLDQAGSYEEVMNMMRGDEASVQERRSELAGLVGPEDAQQTPESVLTLVQPVIQMASVDQGIGGLAQEQMSAPVEGDMAGGIMSTVGMGAPEGPPPVNFNQGGVVRRPGPFPNAMLPDFTSVMEARPSGQILSIPRPPGYTPETPMYLRPSERFRFEDLDQPIPEAIRGMPRDYRSDPISADASSYEQETLGEGGAQLPDTQAAMEGMDPSSESAELAADTVDPLDSLMSELGYGDERSLDEYFQESRDLYRGLISEADREASRSDVREAAKTQFLSDLGKAGLLLASPTASPMSFFEKLSGAVSGSEMFDNLARQAAAISEAERGFRDQDLKLDLAALTDAQKRSLADQDARRALQLKMLDQDETDASLYSIFGPDGNLIQTRALTDNELRNVSANLGTGFTIRKTADEDISSTGGGSQEQYFVVNPNTGDVETFDFGSGPQSNISLQDGAAFNRASGLVAGSGLVLVRGTDLDKFGESSSSGGTVITVQDTTGKVNNGLPISMSASEFNEMVEGNPDSNFIRIANASGSLTSNVLIEDDSGAQYVAGQTNNGLIVNDGLIPGAGDYVSVNQLTDAGFNNIAPIPEAEVINMRNLVEYRNYFTDLAEAMYEPPTELKDYSRSEISELTSEPISRGDYRNLNALLDFDMDEWSSTQSRQVVGSTRDVTGLGSVVARAVDSALGIIGLGFTGDSVQAKQTAKLFNKMVLPGLVTNTSRVSNFDIEQVQPVLLDVGIFGSDNTQLSKMVKLHDLLKYKEAAIIKKGIEESRYAGVMTAQRFRDLQTDLSAVRNSLSFFGNNFEQELLEQFPELSDEMQRNVINNDPARAELYNKLRQQDAAFRVR